MDNATYELNLTPINTDETYSRLHTTQTKTESEYKLQNRAEIGQSAIKGVKQIDSNHSPNSIKYNVVLIIMIVILLLITLASIAYILSALTQLVTTQNDISQILIQLNNSINELFSMQTQNLIPQTQLYCGPGPWNSVAYLNMTDPLQQCPPAWREYNTSGIRACGRPTATEGTCTTVLYSVDRQYNKVCGRLIGYQIASPDGFTGSHTLDQTYIDGISITHGMPQRNHIWSYVAGITERSSGHRNNNCPCSTVVGSGPQSFVGDNYYCESGNPTNTFRVDQLFLDDPLWDGKQCEGTCCTGRNSPPWFSVQLPAPTTDTIEVRICADESNDNEDILIQLLEIFVN